MASCICSTIGVLLLRLLGAAPSRPSILHGYISRKLLRNQQPSLQFKPEFSIGIVGIHDGSRLGSREKMAQKQLVDLSHV